jgi:hypothetical protein
MTRAREGEVEGIRCGSVLVREHECDAGSAVIVRSAHCLEHHKPKPYDPVPDAICRAARLLAVKRQQMVLTWRGQEAAEGRTIAGFAVA